MMVLLQAEICSWLFE